MIIIGLDPGLGGGISLIENEEVKCCVKMPVIKNKKGKLELDMPQIIKLLDVQPAIAYIESISARPGQGVVSMFNFGMGYGMLLGILCALDIEVKKVSPQKWKNVILGGTEKDKAAAIKYCQDNYPTINLIPKGCRVPHDGMADAVCIAAYGRLCLWGLGKRFR